MFLFLGVILSIVAFSGLIFYLFNSKTNSSEKALALAAMGNFLDAKAIARDLLDANPNNSSSLYLMSKIYNMEKDYLNEVTYLEKIKKQDAYDKEISPINVNNRIADIYYQKEKFHEAFFHYLDTIKYDPHNTDALIRLSFMAIGQKEFLIAERFLNQVPEPDVKYPSFYIGRGVVAAMLDRVDEFLYFEKAYQMEPASILAACLYAIANYRMKNYKEAIELVNPIFESISEDTMRYTMHQFIMIQSYLLNDMHSAMQQGRLCIEIAKQNGWKFETAESELYHSMLAIAANRSDETNEYLIEAETLNINDAEIIDLANYKYIIEEGENALGDSNIKNFNLDTALSRLPNKLFPKEKYYELSGLRSPDYINIRAMVNENGEKIVKELNTVSLDKVNRFLNLKGNAFKNVCAKMINEVGYKLGREIPCLEQDGANYIAVSRSDEEKSYFFKIRKWKSVKVSDVFMNETLENIEEQGCVMAYLIGFCELTPGANKILQQHDSKLKVISDKELEYLLEKVLK